jgi:amino acid permease
MGFVLGMIGGVILGIIVGAVAYSTTGNPNQASSAEAEAELRRISEKMRDYYNNPVVEYLKRTNK